jgi:hypothetical protein
MSSEVMEVTIESNITIPERGYRGRGKQENTKYPMGKLGVNDSFWVPKAQAASMRCTASRHKRNNPGWDYTVRTEQQKDLPGCRIWRTA